MRAVRQSGLTLREAISTLKKEGWHVGRHHVAHAIAIKAIPQPPKRGGWRRFSAEHVDGMRRYLAERSRSQPREAGQ
jgi:hypothetical protein